MKKNNFLNIIILLLSVFAIQSCSDFDEINKYPLAAGDSQVQIEYFINNSIIGAQQNPHIAERVFVLYWKDAGRMDRVGTLSEGGSNGDWTRDYYNYLSGWLTKINTAIEVAENKEAAGDVKEYTNNLKQVARIWRAYLMSEGADNFGPFVINGFKGVNPDFSSVEDVYDYMLEELKDASDKLDVSITVDESVAKLDPAYSYDFSKWKKYANSLRMRLAMRLSEVAPEKAKENFEDAVGKGYISSLADDFEVQEVGGWNDLTGVMSRQWNNQFISATLNNLYVGLGGVSSEVSLADNSNFSDLESAIKSADYMGVKYENHFATKTNNPSAGFWFDGLHKVIDPRAYKAFVIPGDVTNSEFNFYPSWAQGQVTNTERALLQKRAGTDDLDTLKLIDAKFTWNAYSLGSWGDKGEINKLVGWPGTQPRLINSLRNSTAKRLFFASWESYFLIAEASIRGWNVPMGGKEAYEKGIKESFDYWGAPGYATYISSENYNRVGTSVSWNHTDEPSSKTVSYKDGYTGASKTMEYEYPVNSLYKSGNVRNDLLTKIITQKFIAQTPWLPLETWNDQRRLGLPFFENPAVEKPLPNLPVLTSSNYMESKIEFFPQRLKYPSTLQGNVPEGYKQAIQLLGGEDEIHTPLWWAKKR